MKAKYSVFVWMRERETERVCVWQRKGERERGILKTEGEIMCDWEWDITQDNIRDKVCVREKEREGVCVCVWIRMK